MNQRLKMSCKETTLAQMIVKSFHLNIMATSYNCHFAFYFENKNHITWFIAFLVWKGHMVNTRSLILTICFKRTFGRIDSKMF